MTAPPNTLLLGETIDVARASVLVRFRAAGTATGVRCALTRSAAEGMSPPRYAPCRSPLVLRNLRAGSYTLRVRAVGPGGPDPTPATYRFSLSV